MTLSVSNAQVTEGNAGTTHLAFPVTLSFPVGATVTATFSLANGTATGGPACATNVDFVNASGTVTIPAGSTTGTATVTVCPDTTLEPDETLTLALANPTNAVLGTATATGTILNDDVAPSPIIPAAPGQADVRIAKTGPANATLGSSPVYTITVTNSGPATAENVTINDPVPTGLTFISNSGACVTVFPCALGSLAAGQTRVITTTLNVPNGYGGPDPIVNVATVTSTTADPNTTNNTAQAKTTPQGQVYDPNNNGKGDKKDKDETSKQTEDQRRNREHTNTGGKDQYATSGQVIAVEKSPDGGCLLVSIKTIDDEPQVVAFACPNGECPDIIEKDVIEVDGVQGGDLPEQKGWFMAESFDYVTRAPRGR